MVKKLFKHEFSAWLRIMWIVYAVMLTVACVNRIFQCFESDSTAFLVLTVLGIVAFVLTLTVCVVFCEVFGVVRFYKNLFTGEGYLSFTLPVSTAAHIWVKALTAGAMMLLTMLVALLSVFIVSAGDLLTEIGKAAAYLLKQLPADARGHLVGYGVEIFLLILAGCMFMPMLYYACICIGQLFRKHRVLGAIGVYFGYYYICQAITGVISVVISLLESQNTEDVMELTGFPYEAFHIVLIGGIVLNVGIGMLYFWICHHITTKKLNLE